MHQFMRNQTTSEVSSICEKAQVHFHLPSAQFEESCYTLCHSDGHSTSAYKLLICGFVPTRDSFVEGNERENVTPKKKGR